MAGVGRSHRLRTLIEQIDLLPDRLLSKFERRQSENPQSEHRRFKPPRRLEPVTKQAVAVLERYGTDPDLPLRQGPYRSSLRDERLAAILGSTLGVLFLVCFATGLYSHLQQHPQHRLPIPARPAGLYRLTQGIHIGCGIALFPVLLAKLWLIWPRFLAFPPLGHVRRLRDAIPRAIERLGLLPLVGGSLFMVFSGIADVAQWYPWRFSFTAAHFWVAWLTMGALVAHFGAKWAIARRALARPSRRPRLAEADPELEAVAESPKGGLSRRGFLVTVGAAAGLLTVVTVGQTATAVRKLAILAPRNPTTGPQGRPVNRSAGNAGVRRRAVAASYRLTVSGRVTHPLTMTEAQLVAMATSASELPIACVEGWSYSARWHGIRMRDLLAAAGAAPGASVRIESLELHGAYAVSTLDPGQADDPDTLLATHLDGERLDLDHGFPCRLIAPNRPGVLQTKWVTNVVVI